MNRRSLSPAWLGAALALIGLAAAAAPAWAQGGPWTPIPVPGGPVFGVADGDSGRVLIAGNNGPWRFDGFRMRRLPIFSSTTDSLQGKAILRTFTGDIWFGTLVGAFVLRTDGSVVSYSATSGLGDFTSSEVTCLAQDAAGDIWAGTGSGGLSRFNGTSWTTITTDQGLPSQSITSVAVDPTDQSLWVGTLGLTSGLAHVVNGAVAAVYNTFSLTPSRNVRAVTATASGEVWFGTDGGIGRIKSGVLSEYATSGSAVSSLAEGASGEIWFGTLNRGIGRLDNGVATFFPSGPPSNTVQHLFVDPAGVLWASTSGGLGRYEGAPWLPIAQATGQPAGFAPVSAARDPARDAPGDSIDARGVTWLGLQSIPGSGLDVLNLACRVNGNVRFFGTADGLPGGPAAALAPADSGQVWVGSYVNSGSDGLARITLDGLVRQVETSSLPSTSVFALRRAGPSSVWAGTRLGVALVDPAGVHALPTGPAAVPDAPIRGLDIDPQGRLWIATGVTLTTQPPDGRAGQGAVRFDPADSSYLRVALAEGLPTNNLTSVAAFRNGDVWFGSALGAARWRAGGITLFTVAQSLPNNSVTRIAEGPNGEAWIATSGGLVEYDGANLTAYGVGDGMSGSTLFNLFVDSLGVIASLRNDGASLFHVDRTPPQADIFAAPPAVGGAAEVTFGVRGGDLESGTRGLLLSYQLDNRPQTPFADDVTSARFLALPDGDHTFRLWAKDRALNLTPQPEVWNFTIDATAPRPIVESPAFNDVVKDTVAVVGSVFDPRFAGYTIEVRPQGRVAWDTLFTSTTLPTQGDTLYLWNTNAQLDGVWELRVGSRDNLGLTGYVQVTTIVDNLAPSASVTSPARIDHVQGGQVFTTLGEVELDIPPNAYEADQTVIIDPIPTPPAAPAYAPLGSSWASGWFIHADDMTLAKPATLIIQLPGVPAGVPVALYRMAIASDTTLVPLGGARSADGLALSTTISELGHFVVLYGVGVGGPAGFAGARDLDCQPRVLSPNGGGFDTRLAISFDIGRAGNGAVKVFDRAGRLVREVVEDGAFVPGRNVVFWDGRDGSGKVVPSGLYMVAVRFDGGTQVASVAVANR